MVQSNSNQIESIALQPGKPTISIQPRQET
jgi:hypothetical protein